MPTNTETNNIVCCICGVAFGHNPHIIGISHGYCPACYQVELAQVKAWVAQQSLTRAAANLATAQTEYEAAKAEFEAIKQ